MTTPNVSSKRPLPRTSAFARVALLRLSHGRELHQMSVRDIESQIRHRWPTTEHARVLAEAVAGSDTGAIGTSPAGLFVEAVRQVSIVGALAVHEVPLRVSIPALVTAANATVVGAGKSIPCSSATFGLVGLTGRKAATVVVVSKELLKTPFADRNLQSTLFASMVKATDAEFISTNVAAGAPVASGANDVIDATWQLGALIDAVAAGAEATDRIAVVMHPRQALRLSLLTTDVGQPVFPEIQDRRIRTVPLIQSSGCPVDVVAAVDGYRAAAAWGTAELVPSDAALIEMSDAPTGDIGQDDGTPAAATVTRVSMFMTDTVAMKCVLHFDFKMLGSGGFKYLANFNPLNESST